MEDQPLALVVGGTGMLRPAVKTLLNRGQDVAVLARRPERGAPTTPTRGRYIPLTGDWTASSSFAEELHTASGGRKAHSVIVWVHEPHRPKVMEHLCEATAPDAAVVHLWGSATRDPRETIGTEAGVGGHWRMHHVVLGYTHDAATPRWLTSSAISMAALTALDQKQDYLIAGQIDPWNQRP